MSAQAASVPCDNLLSSVSFVPFELVEDVASGDQYMVGKIKVGYLAASSCADMQIMMIRLMLHCVRVKDAKREGVYKAIPHEELMNMEIALYNKLSAVIGKQFK